MVRLPFVMVGPSAPTAPLCRTRKTTGSTSQPHNGINRYRRNLPVIAGHPWHYLSCHNLPTPKHILWQLSTVILCQVGWFLLDRLYPPLNDLVSGQLRYCHGDSTTGELQ